MLSGDVLKRMEKNFMGYSIDINNDVNNYQHPFNEAFKFDENFDLHIGSILKKMMMSTDFLEKERESPPLDPEKKKDNPYPNKDLPQPPVEVPPFEKDNPEIPKELPPLKEDVPSSPQEIPPFKGDPPQTPAENPKI